MLASSMAEGLRFLCTISRAAIDSNVIIFQSGSIYTANAMPDYAENNFRSFINDLPKYAISQVVPILSSYSYGISTAQYISGLGTNSVAYILSDLSNTIKVSPTVYQMEDGSYCYCMPTIRCSAPAAIYPNARSLSPSLLTINTSNVLVKGMRTGCYAYEALLDSTLECYYDVSCLQLLVSNISSFKPLNQNTSSRFLMHDTVSTILNVGMVERFTYDYSAEAYYRECAPAKCFYTYKQYGSLLTVVTTIIGIISGLNSVIRFIAPRFISIFLKIRLLFRPSTDDLRVTVPVTPAPSESKSQIRIDILDHVCAYVFFQDAL